MSTKPYCPNRPSDRFISPGLTAMPMPNAFFGLSSARMHELRERVRRGALYMRWTRASTAWISEALDPDFSIRYLEIRSRASNPERSLFIQAFWDLEMQKRYMPSRFDITPQTYFGFDIEPEIPLHSLHHRVMDSLWLHEAGTLREILIDPKG